MPDLNETHAALFSIPVILGSRGLPLVVGGPGNESVRATLERLSTEDLKAKVLVNPRGVFWYFFAQSKKY